MAKERKKRYAKKSSVDTSKLKSYGGDFKSRGEQKLSFAKTVKDEAEKVQSQIAEEQSKAQEKSLWSSIGGALGGLALGLATGGSTWAIQAAAAGVGTYVGAQGGKVASEAKSGKRKDIKSDMFYEKEAEKQNLAFQDFDDELNKSILNRSLAAGAMTAAFVGGGELVEKLKTAKAAKIAEKSKKAKDALGLPQKLEQAQKGAEFVMSTDISGLGQSSTMNESIADLVSTSGLPSDISVASGYDNIMIDKTLGKSSYTVTDALAESVGMGGDDIFANSNLAFRNANNISSSFASSLTPLADEAAPSIMDSYLKGIAGQKSKSMQQSLLAAGGMSLYGYRPELESLRQIQFGTNIKPYG